MALIKKLVAKQATIEEKNCEKKKKIKQISPVLVDSYTYPYIKVSSAKYNLPLSMLDPDSKSWLLLLN